jgi:hypothetical protein
VEGNVLGNNNNELSGMFFEVNNPGGTEYTL